MRLRDAVDMLAERGVEAIGPTIGADLATKPPPQKILPAAGPLTHRVEHARLATATVRPEVSKR